MSHAIEYIAESLKAARERKGLSQRTLGTKAGVPQGHISRIENGAVDLRLSSLVELGRVLDLELTLVPRKKLPAVRAIIRWDDNRPLDVQGARKAANMLRHLEGRIKNLPAELLSEVAVRKLRRLVHELAHFRLSSNDLDYLREATAAMKEFMCDPRNSEGVERAQNQLCALRNALAHGADASATSLPRPAYRFDGDDHG